MNSGDLIGNLGQNPTISVFASGKKVTRFSIALNNYARDKAPTWITCELWDDAVDRFQKCSVRQGTKIAVSGQLGLKEYEQQINGTRQKVRSHFVKVFTFSVLTPKGESVENTASISDNPDQLSEPMEQTSDEKAKPKRTAVIG